MVSYVNGNKVYGFILFSIFCFKCTCEFSVAIIKENICITVNYHLQACKLMISRPFIITQHLHYFFLVSQYYLSKHLGNAILVVEARFQNLLFLEINEWRFHIFPGAHEGLIGYAVNHFQLRSNHEDLINLELQGYQLLR